MTKVLTSVVAVLIGTVWILGPAAAQTTTDKMENKAERAKDKTESKTESAMDKVKEKAHDAKEKIVETKDKVVDKVKGKKNKVAAKSEETNVRAAQQALRDQGYNPGPIDGVMGPRTSVRDYQTKQGLTASGQLDDATMDKLGVRGASSASPTTEPQTTAPGAQKSKQTP